MMAFSPSTCFCIGSHPPNVSEGTPDRLLDVPTQSDNCDKLLSKSRCLEYVEFRMPKWRVMKVSFAKTDRFRTLKLSDRHSMRNEKSARWSISSACTPYSPCSWRHSRRIGETTSSDSSSVGRFKSFSTSSKKNLTFFEYGAYVRISSSTLLSACTSNNVLRTISYAKTWRFSHTSHTSNSPCSTSLSGSRLSPISVRTSRLLSICTNVFCSEAQNSWIWSGSSSTIRLAFCMRHQSTSRAASSRNSALWWPWMFRRISSSCSASMYIRSAVSRSAQARSRSSVSQGSRQRRLRMSLARSSISRCMTRRRCRSVFL
mmetsp:Transcript_55443/g.92218  ORF Transcript_55443/g.92218 Transcript_55443/m.92218 type:complete len:316 (+) Transcript_55443:313-1260(+)